MKCSRTGIYHFQTFLRINIIHSKEAGKRVSFSHGREEKYYALLVLRKDLVDGTD
jgi:hypothetical protein